MTKTFKALSLAVLATALALTAAAGATTPALLPKKKTLDPANYTHTITDADYNDDVWWIHGWTEVTPIGPSGTIQVYITVKDSSSFNGNLIQTCLYEWSYATLPGVPPTPTRVYWEFGDDWGTPPICWSGRGWLVDAEVWVKPNNEPNAEYYSFNSVVIPGPFAP